MLCMFADGSGRFRGWVDCSVDYIAWNTKSCRFSVRALRVEQKIDAGLSASFAKQKRVSWKMLHGLECPCVIAPALREFLEIGQVVNVAELVLKRDGDMGRGMYGRTYVLSHVERRFAQ